MKRIIGSVALVTMLGLPVAQVFGLSIEEYQDIKSSNPLVAEAYIKGVGDGIGLYNTALIDSDFPFLYCYQSREQYNAGFSALVDARIASGLGKKMNDISAIVDNIISDDNKCWDQVLASYSGKSKVEYAKLIEEYSQLLIEEIKLGKKFKMLYDKAGTLYSRYNGLGASGNNY